MTYSNARIVRGNDFKLQITVEAPRDYVSGETIWDSFDLTECSEIHVALICEKDQIVIPLEYEIVPGTTNVLLCPVHGNYLHSGAAYGVEVKGVDGSGYAWRWKAKGKEMFSIVDNTSAQNLDDNLTPKNFDINARVGFEIHVDLSDYYTKEQVDASQAAQDEAIAALDNKVDANEADIEAKLAAERTRAQGAESTLQDNIDAEQTRAKAAEQALSDAIDTLSGSTEGSLVQITARIAAEETRAQAAEGDLQDDIDANSSAITTETTRAQAAEQANATAISTETSRAQGAESTLQENIDAEETRAKAAEQANANAIASEVTRATGAEEANATAISNEATRAQGAEQGLQDQIDALEAAAGGDISGLTQRIAAEETRAQAAEQAIDADVTALEAAMPLKANSADLATVATSGSYNDLSNKPTIPVVPTNVSAFTNDSGYLVAADIAGKADKSDTYTKDEVDEKIDDIIGGDIDLQNYYTKEQVDASQTAQDTVIASKAPQATTYTKTEVDNLISPKANSADLATVATSGSYNDLTDKPDIPAMQVQSDWNQTGINEPDYIKNKPTIPTVPTNVSAFTNDAGYLVSSDIAGKADKSDTYTKNEVDQIIEEVEAGQGSSLNNYYTKTQIDSQQQVQDAAIANKANSADLATVATTGDYDDLINKPTIPTAQVQSDWGETGTGEPSFIKNKPTNVSAFTNDAGYLTQHQSLDNYYTKTEVDNKDSVLSNAILLRAPQATTYTKTEVDNLVSPKANSADLATVATSGSYNDLSDKPHIPNDQVQADWAQTGTSEPDYIKNKPTNVSAFTNDAGYLTEHQSLDNYYTKTQVDEYENTQNLAILSKADKSTTYTKTEVDNLVSPKANSADLATVATSGSYNDLSNKPHIPNDQVQADWGQTGMTEPDYIKNKPTNVSAFTNDVGYLVSSDIAGKADKSTTYTKTEVDNLVSPKANSADLATVATSGSYNDLLNKPHIPNDQVQADWGETGTGEPSFIKNKPTNVSAFNNDAGYLTEHQSLDNYYTKTQVDEIENTQNLAILSKAPQATTYTKAEVDNLVSPKANSADLATVATSGSYNDLRNKPTIPTGVTFEVLPTKFADGTIAFDINELHDGKLGSSYATKIANCDDTEEAEEWWDDNGLVELYYSTDNGTTWSNYNMSLYVSPTPGPTKIQLGTNGIWWKLYWYDDLNHEIASDILTGDTDLSNYYTKTQADDKFLASYRKIQLSTESLGHGDDVETWHGVGQFWAPVDLYWGSGEYDKNSVTGYEFPQAYDSANDNYYVKIYNVHAGDGIRFKDLFLKETPSSTPHMLIIDNSGTTVWSDEMMVNSQANPGAKWPSYTFTDDYDYIIIGTDCDKPAYVQSIDYYVPLADNSDLAKVIPTIRQVEQALNNKVNTWDIVQSDWTQTDTGAKDYIKNKPNLATVATSGSYNDLTNKPNEVYICTNTTTVAQVEAALTANKFLYFRDGTTSIKLLPYVAKDNYYYNFGAIQCDRWYYNRLSISTGVWEGVSTGYQQQKINSSNKLSASYVSGLANVATSGSYNDLSDKPTNVSTFTNDAGYLTQHQSLANCVQSTTANMKIEVVSAMPASPLNNTLYVVYNGNL